MSKQFEIPDGYELLMSEPKLISELTKDERKKIGRKVLNSTLKNSPPGTKIYGSGDLILPDGSLVARTGHGRGKNAQYDFTPPEGYEVVPEPAKVDTATEETYEQSVEDVRKVRKEEGKERYDAYQERLAEDGNDTADITPVVAQRDVEDAAEGLNEASGKQEPSFLDKALQVAQDNITSTPRSLIEMVVNGRDAVDQAGRDGFGSVIGDAGNGVMGELADVVGADDSAQWWRDRQTSPDGGAAAIGSSLTDEAMFAAGGGVLGHVIGRLYKGRKLAGEALNDRASHAAANAKQIALEHGYSPEQLPMMQQSAFENMTKIDNSPVAVARKLLGAKGTPRNTRGDVPYHPPLSSSDKFTKVVRDYNIDGVNDWLPHSTVDAIAGDRAMLKRNDRELNDLFSQGNALDQALKLRQERWDRLPNDGAVTGALISAGIPKQYGRNSQSAFEGIELEGGMPSYEAVKNMSDEKYDRYNRQYLGGAGLP